MNSIFQLLLFTPNFLISLFEKIDTIDNLTPENHVLTALCELLYNLYIKKYKSYNPSLFRSILCWNNVLYNSFEQQDASMFLLTLFDYFDSCKCYDIIKDLFEGEEDVLINGDCHHISKKKENFLYK